MELTDVYAKSRRSIIALASKAVLSKTNPAFPEILGTAFVIDERGIAVTNRHVVRALEKLQRHPKTKEHPAIAIALSDVQPTGVGHSLEVVFPNIRRWDKLTTFTSSDKFYGEQIPDVAFVQLDVRGLPALPLVTEERSWEIGTQIATAGFPLGKDALVIYGQVNQVAPILRVGVIASVYPFPCPKPHGFTIDIMTLGGESGSPIFLQHQPAVVGLLHAGFNHTNITMAIPSWIVQKMFESYLQKVPLDFSGVPSLEDLLEKKKAVSTLSSSAV